MRLAIVGFTILVLALLLIGRGTGDRTVIFMATTTTQDSGLLGVLIPELENDTGLKIQTIAFGTGSVLRAAREGNADVILVHDPQNELIFMNEGYGTERIAVMQNNFVVVGPANDPANISESEHIQDAFLRIAESNAPFVSRADQSGTHNAEMRVWASVELNPQIEAVENYLETGTGMGRTLNVAVEKSAYVLTDSATWITYDNKGDHKVLFSGDEMLSNIYHLITVNAESHPHISAESQKMIVDWFKSDKMTVILDQFSHQGQTLYFPVTQ